jgi:AraC-like DNA-binding protein
LLWVEGMLEDLSFGWRTALLTVAFVQLILIAVALTRALHNRTANRTMAALLLVLAGIITPWLIGFAGFYDKWRWLTFAPLQITLAVGPLFWLYVYALVTGDWPQKAKRHLILPAAQFLFYFASFLLPMPLKEWWADIIGLPADIITGLLLVAGLTAYGSASLKLLQRYRTALSEARSDDHLYAARWLQAALVALFVMLIIWTIYLFWDLISPLGYKGLMGLYIAIAIFALYLGIEAWRHTALPFPTLDSLRPAADTLPPSKDWKALGESWAQKLREEGWDQDPELSLPLLARRLGTNTGHLSRAINEGLGQSFSDLINGLRARRVAAMIDEGRKDDLLDLALDAGFSSKASFNRAFSAALGMPPSAYRKRLKS